ncbi:MAG: PfkB family carbohydrate kinase [Ignavibacteria bacterium]|nr:PfkB family carbohydrate kinase [Ignavibacteria bacterium]
MILTVTLHPLLEKRLSYDVISVGSFHRNPKEELKPGGKGINVCRQLNKFGVKNLTYTFLGGNNGKIIKLLLSEEKIDFTFVQTKNETRYSVITIDNSNRKATTFFGPDYHILFQEVEEFKLKLEKMIKNCEIVVFSGSSPCRETDSVFPFGIEISNRYNKISVCDTYGNHLKDCIEQSPTVLHNNVFEVEQSLNISLKTENDKLNFLNHLYSKGIKQSFITNGKEDIYASNFDYHYKVENLKIEEVDATGSGDSFVAGIVYNLYKDKTFEESIKLASALGSLNALTLDICNVSLDEAEKIADQIKLSTIGKKMKTIDVTPR